MASKISNAGRRGSSRVAQKPPNPIPRAPSSRQIVIQYTLKPEERPKSVQRDQTGRIDIRTYKPILRRREKTDIAGTELLDLTADPYKLIAKGGKTSRGSSMESDVETGAYTARAGNQPNSKKLTRSFTGESGKENCHQELKQPRVDSIQHHRGFIQPRPLSNYVMPTKASKFTTNPVAVHPCIQNSCDICRFYQRLEALEELLERDLQNRQKVRVPKGFFCEEDGDGETDRFV